MKKEQVYNVWEDDKKRTGKAKDSGMTAPITSNRAGHRKPVFKRRVNRFKNETPQNLDYNTFKGIN